jgi:hypothetical protein
MDRRGHSQPGSRDSRGSHAGRERRQRCPGVNHALGIDCDETFELGLPTGALRQVAEQHRPDRIRFAGQRGRSKRVHVVQRGLAALVAAWSCCWPPRQSQLRPAEVAVQALHIARVGTSAHLPGVYLGHEFLRRFCGIGAHGFSGLPPGVDHPSVFLVNERLYSVGAVPGLMEERGVGVGRRRPPLRESVSTGRPPYRPSSANWARAMSLRCPTAAFS